MKQIQKGFTLIELMIVVAIIGILAAVAIPAYQDYVIKAKLSKVQSTLDPVKLALAMYYQENGSFPAGTETALTVQAASAANGLFSSIGLANTPTLPAEVSTLVVDGTALSSVTLTLTVGAGKIKANTIDNLKVQIGGSATGTAVTWACIPAGTTITESLALKYFGC
ncbi:MAG: prepilin-type N-terminal cleavage/methylation domain-containing protein [Gallionellaceae bacterium]|nr:prepilin-type N-terminal cleavage/methylation domain-containing protein [Gallionellaceae bacterium]